MTAAVVELKKCSENHLAALKREMQRAFQQAAQQTFLDLTVQVLPEGDIDRSLSHRNAVCYEACVNGERIGGCILLIDPKTKHNHLDFLYVKVGFEGRGFGQQIWWAVEKLYPDTISWETGTPYFEKRNLHFYINVLGFHAVEFFNSHHRMPDESNLSPGCDEFFIFKKEMKPKSDVEESVSF